MSHSFKEHNRKNVSAIPMPDRDLSTGTSQWLRKEKTKENPRLQFILVLIFKLFLFSFYQTGKDVVQLSDLSFLLIPRRGNIKQRLVGLWGKWSLVGHHLLSYPLQLSGFSLRLLKKHLKSPPPGGCLWRAPQCLCSRSEHNCIVFAVILLCKHS